MYLGVTGIVQSAHYTPQIKLGLLIDYFRLSTLLMANFLGHNPTSVAIHTFNLRVSINGYKAFFYLFNEIFCRGVYPAQTGLKNYIDGGANIGLTMLWFRLWNPQLQMTGFEPSRQVYHLLQRNLRQNKAKNYQLHQIALETKIGTGTFYLIDDPIQSLGSGLKPDKRLTNHAYQVKTAPLSSYIKGAISLLKLDIEGSEYAVIEDLLKTNKINLVEMMIIEAHYFNRADLQLMKKMIKNLSAKGQVEVITTNRNSSMIYYRSMCIITQ